MTDTMNWNQCPMDISDDDIVEAMKSISGFLDITPADFREIYLIAYKHSFERLSKAVKAVHVMTRNVIAVKEDTPLIETAELLSGHSISGLPVLDAAGCVKGVISEKDFLYEMGGHESRKVMNVITHLMKNKECAVMTLAERKAADIMTSPAITVQEETTVFEIAGLFDQRKINRVPVVDRNSKLTGIVTRSDIVQSFCMRNI